MCPLPYLIVVPCGVPAHPSDFPSAGANEPQYAAGRGSAIASIGYCAFLAGPPGVGFLGDHFAVLRVLVAVSVLLAAAALLSAVIAVP